MSERMPSYGGQAVIEGVLMRGARHMALAMRAPNQQIVVQSEPLSGIYLSKAMKIPFLRGLVGLWDALGLGMRALTIATNLQTGEDDKLEGGALAMTMGVSILIGIALFALAPAAVGHLVEKLLGPQSAVGLANGAAWIGNLVEGLVRLALLIGYIWAIGFMPEIRRMFAYHGAEHKTINAFEAGAELTPETVSQFSVEHPRCGTSFMLTLVLLSVLIFSLMGPLPMAARLLSRVLFLPVLAGLAYEFIRFTARNLHRPLVRALVRPNLALQHLTTRQPDLAMLEVAITAFKTMYALEHQADPAPQ